MRFRSPRRLGQTDACILGLGFPERDSTGIRIVPFGSGKEKILLPWKGLGDTQKLCLNLLDCVKTREQPACSIDIAVRVQAPLSMGVIAHRKNSVVLFDQQNQSRVLS